MRKKAGISHTAWLVMLSQIGLVRQARWKSLAAVEDLPFYLACYDYCKSHSMFYLAAHLLIPLRFHLWLIEKLLVRGAPQHFVLRKRSIAGHVQRFLSGGAQQLVVIGAGFDALACRIARAYPHITCYEIDAPEMHRHKQAIIDGLYGNSLPNLHLLGADLSQVPLETALLQAAGYSRDKPTLFVMEGVAMYLSEEAVRKTLAAMRSLGPLSGLVFTAVGPQRTEIGGSGWAAAQTAILKAKGETFNWRLPMGEMQGFLAGEGLRLLSSESYADLQKPWRLPAEYTAIERLNGEYIVSAASA